MNSVKIKICGMRDAENMRQIAALAPDFFGLIFYPKSPRFISVAEAENLPHFPEIRRVGVFVNENSEVILETAVKAKLSFVQLHGDESPAFCLELKKRNSELRIIKVFNIGADFDARVLKDYEAVCDYFLFDTKTDKRGGSGEIFDWTILQNLDLQKPFFLSGGIGAENVFEAIAACENLPLFALDFNSRIESAAGVKSFAMVNEIFRRGKGEKRRRGEKKFGI